jgi:hypothetical protein
MTKLLRPVDCSIFMRLAEKNLPLDGNCKKNRQ